MAWYHTYQLLLQYIAFAGAACGSVGLFLIWLSRTDFAAIRRIPPPLRCVFALAFIFAAFASQKQSVRDSLFSASSSSSSPASLSSTTQDNEPDSTTEEEANDGTSDEPVAPDPPAAESNTNCLHIARYAPPPVNELDVAWPNPGYHAEDIRLYGTWNLRTNYVAVAPRTISYFPDLSGATFGIDWPSAFSNAVSRGVFPQDATLNQGFFTAAWYNVDTDNDGIPDADEIFIHHTDPDNPDSDGDGLSDGWELNHSYNPHSTDSNGDGILDAIAASLNLSATTTDTDGDGLSDAEELNFGTSPTDSDSDGDGVSDGEEVRCHRDPLFDEEQMVDPPSDIGNCFTVSGTARIESLQVAPEDEENFVGLTIDTSDPSGAGLVRATNPEFTVRITGTTFTPTITGEYAFQIDSDDDGELTVGHITAAGSYYDGSEEVRGIFKAGVSYPISVTLHNEGGPAKLRSVVFGRLTKVYPEGIVNSFSKKALFYEDAYTNVVARGNIGQLETVMHDLRVTAGPEGGCLQIVKSNLDKLKLLLGTGIDSEYVSLGPFETYSARGLYCGESPSLTTNDVSVAVRWTNRDNEPPDVSSLTVFYVYIEATAETPTLTRRRRFGVAEKVNFHFSPRGVGAQLNKGQLVFEDDNSTVHMPDYADSGEIKVYFENDEHILYWNCLEPESRKAQSVRTTNLTLDENGNIRTLDGTFGAGMVVSLKLEPSDVSFTGLYCIEGDCAPTNKTGIFSHPAVHLDSHDVNHGAWEEFEIGEDNFAGDDTVSFGIETATGLPPDEISKYEFHIPVYWSVLRPTDDDDLNLFATNIQVMCVYTNGDASVSKFGETRRRSSSGVYYRQ